MSYETPPPPGQPSYGSTPPPPPYGGPPPAGPPGGFPPAPGGYGGPGQPQQFEPAEPLSWAWAKFQANMAQMVIAALAIFVGAIVIMGLGFVILNALSGFAGLFMFMLFFAAFVVYAMVVGAGMVRGALGVTQGRAFVAAEVFDFKDLGPVVVTALILGVGSAIPVVGIVVGFVLQYALFFVVDKKLEPVAAAKASYELVTANLVPTLLWYVIAGVVVLIGECLCGVGLLAAIPVVVLGSAFVYKKLLGEPIVA